MRFYDCEIICGYNFLRRRAIRACRKGDVCQSIFWVEKLSAVANQLNWRFYDEKLTQLMDNLSQQMLGQAERECSCHPKRVVFYDQYGKYFILALQYIDALTAAGYEILYILSDYVQTDSSTSIVEDIKHYRNVKVEVVTSQLSYQQRAEYIFQLTLHFAPSMIFMHVKSFSVFNLVLPKLPKTILNYYIDLQDHGFWIKNSNINYVLPYRDFGAIIDIEQRGFHPRQVLKMPYYPIITKTSFQGFPPEAYGKVVVFTGGEYYKTIDRNNTYWRLIVRLLIENPEAVVLYAGKGDVELCERAVSDLSFGANLNNRLIPIGFRSDISEVFAHCDIYMGTSPMSGGLMSQYAAYYAKPILQYYRPDMASNNETEQVLDFNNHLTISFTDELLFLQEAKRLVSDCAYRVQKGKSLQNCLISRNQFNALLKKTLQHRTNQVPINYQRIQYKALVRWWFYLERKGVFNCRAYLLSQIGKYKYIIMPFSAIIKRLVNNARLVYRYK